MPQEKIWTLHEKLQVSAKAIEMEKAGEIGEEECRRIMKTIPMTPYLAKIAKEYFGADYLIKSGLNLSEADEEYGSDWLTR